MILVFTFYDKNYCNNFAIIFCKKLCVDIVIKQNF